MYMTSLRQIIRENLLLEKKIGQISSKMEFSFNFLVDRSNHAYLRRIRTDIEGYDEREISNDEILYFVDLFKRKISEKIASHEIMDGVPFVIKSAYKSLALAIVPIHEYGTYWKMMITTVFRESYENPFRVGKDQLVIYLDND